MRLPVTVVFYAPVQAETEHEQYRQAPKRLSIFWLEEKEKEKDESGAIKSMPVCPPSCLTAYFSACLWSFLLSFMPVSLPACVTSCLSACLLVCLPVCQSGCLAVLLSACLPAFLYSFLYFNILMCLFTSLPSLHRLLSVCLHFCLPVCFFFEILPNPRNSESSAWSFEKTPLKLKKPYLMPIWSKRIGGSFTLWYNKLVHFTSVISVTRVEAIYRNWVDVA